jgi:hypothetical protein
LCRSLYTDAGNLDGRTFAGHDRAHGLDIVRAICRVADSFERVLHHTSRDGLGKRRERRRVQPRRGPVPLADPLECGRRVIGQSAVVSTRQIRQPAERLTSRGVEVPLEVGQQFMTHTIARIHQIRVGRIVVPRLAAPGQFRLEPRARAGEERPDSAVARRRDAAKTTQTGAANHVEQDRLRLVVRGVRRRDAVGRACSGHVRKKLAARIPCREFDGDAVPPRAGRDVDPHAFERYAARLSQRAAKGFVLIRCLAANRMIDVGDRVENQFAARVQVVKQQEQCHGIRAAGNCCDDTRIGTPQIVPPGEMPHTFEHSHFELELST